MCRPSEEQLKARDCDRLRTHYWVIGTAHDGSKNPSNIARDLEEQEQEEDAKDLEDETAQLTTGCAKNVTNLTDFPLHAYSLHLKTQTFSLSQHHATLSTGSDTKQTTLHTEQKYFYKQ